MLLDLNLRAMTLPAQTSESDVIALADMLGPADNVESLPNNIRQRARIIKNVIWDRATRTDIADWEREYLVPLFLVGYGLLVYLDTARNQAALVASVLALAEKLMGALPELRS